MQEEKYIEAPVVNVYSRGYSHGGHSDRIRTDRESTFCYYKRWGVKKKHGHKPVIPLRFSKSGTPEIEKAYATHYVDLNRDKSGF